MSKPKYDDLSETLKLVLAPLIDGLDATDIDIVDSAEHFTAEDIEGALAELFTSVSDGKIALVADIETKGGTVTPAGDVPTFTELGAGIASIPAGGGGYEVGWNVYTLTDLVVSSVDKPV